MSDLPAGVTGHGTYRPPERPGFGLALDWDYVERYTVDRRATP
jgi:L-alanine-DL-glutamate epimerase-like enolase superfamily enzyme